MNRLITFIRIKKQSPTKNKNNSRHIIKYIKTI
jgi:hypothetical protein